MTIKIKRAPYDRSKWIPDTISDRDLLRFYAPSLKKYSFTDDEFDAVLKEISQAGFDIQWNEKKED